jgi:hypothetical protein
MAHQNFTVKSSIPITIAFSNYTNVVSNGSYTIFSYRTVGSYSNAITITGNNPSAPMNIQIFAIGGGGAGGSSRNSGGGGGAGGIVQSSLNITSGDTISLTVGAGGTFSATTNSNLDGGNTNVSFTTNSGNNITAYGGGGGGGFGGITGSFTGRNGGCGGGGTIDSSSGSASGGTGVSGQGFAGGTSTSNGSGGGGTATAGASATGNGGNGGDGKQISLSMFSGSVYANYYWGGGGGGGGTYSAGGNGGKGGGGGGSPGNGAAIGLGDQNGISYGNYAARWPPSSTNFTPDGGANTGGGGGGCAQDDQNTGWTVGKGGSGIILIAVPTSYLKTPVVTVQAGVLDTLSSSAKLAMVGIYALNRCFINYTGPMVRIQRSSDNAISDFYANPSGTLGTAYDGTGTSLSTWLSSATGYVTIFYDQSSRGKHLYQTTNTNTSTNNPYIKYDGSNVACIYFGGTFVGSSMQLTSQKSIWPYTTTSNFHVHFVSTSITWTTNDMWSLNNNAVERCFAHCPWDNGYWYFDAPIATRVQIAQPVAVNTKAYANFYRSSATALNGILVNGTYGSISNTSNPTVTVDTTGIRLNGDSQADHNVYSFCVFSIPLYNTADQTLLNSSF